MMYAIGVVLFALAILLSVAWHECGHMWMARATGMKVRRYFIGFGPTLWSTTRPNKLGDTEYGIKAVPLGGFCDIAGMTVHDEIAPEDRKHAMYRQKVWKRVAVLAAGPGMNVILGLVVTYGIAVAWGLPNLNPPPATIAGTDCVAPETSFGKVADCTGAGPAAAAGIRAGDVIVGVGGTKVSSFPEAASRIRQSSGPTEVTVQRDGQRIDLVVDVARTQRYVSETETAEAGVIGVKGVQGGPAAWNDYNALTAVPATFVFTGELGVKLTQAVANIPSKMGALVRSIGGAERDPETPMSVVGASRIGGETAERGLWVMFWMMLAQLNFVLALINLLPLLPFDGGHIAVACYEKVRDLLRKVRGLMPAGPVDYLKLMPATYVILAVVGVFTVLTITADLINPITIPK